MSKLDDFPFLSKMVSITGPMRVAKTVRLIEYIYRYSQCQLKCLVFKHIKDTRYTSDNLLIAHNGAQLTKGEFVEIVVFDNTLIRSMMQEKEKFDGFEVVAMDEAHFLTIGAADDFSLLADFASYVIRDLNKGFIFTAIDRWASGETVKMVSHCIDMVKPDDIIYCKGICSRCKSPHGIFTMKISAKSSTVKSEEDNIEIGGAEIYITVCRKCFHK